MNGDQAKWYWTQKIRRAADALNNNGFITVSCENIQAAQQAFRERISADFSIGYGGSATLEELGIRQIVQEIGCYEVNPKDPNLPREQILEQRRQALLSDLFLCSTNAVSETGELINLDGYGNRVAAMTFGPKQVFVFAGANKIVSTAEAGILRIEELAGPINCYRLDRNTPCRQTGICHNCDSPERICNVLTVHHKQNIPNRITIFLIAEQLGF